MGMTVRNSNPRLTLYSTPVPALGPLPEMFEDPDIRVFSFAEVPLDRDIYLMDEKWMSEYEKMLVGALRGGDYEAVGYISYAAARAVNRNSIELSWYPNIHDRFHEMKIMLPRHAFVTCVDCYELDEKPRIFVKGSWLTNLHLRRHSAFVLIDAIGVKSALLEDTLSREKLVSLRDRIDTISSNHKDMSFVSFADSLLVKADWSVGQYDSEIKYTYNPEPLLTLLQNIQSAYREILGLEIYAVVAQGINEYYDDALLHISAAGNHISLNSLGLPFAQLLSIDQAVRSAIKSNKHDPAQIYLDEDFYHSLRFRFEFKKNEWPRYAYKTPMGHAPSFYFCNDLHTLLENLRSDE